tara:strand:+ start:10676 stop:11779 length:1104 start_codon:yes stop_codon:yes gene_type:complete
MVEKHSLVIDTRMINNSGIGVYLKNILPELIKEFNVILMGNGAELALFPWTKEVRIIEFKPKIYSIKEQLLYPFIVPKTDLFWCPHFNAPLLPIKAKRILTTIYDVNHLANRNTISWVKWIYAKILYTSATIRSKKIITISKFSKLELIKYTKAKERKINIIYCGVNYDFFNKKRYHNQIVLPKNYILYVGNVKPHKNLITLLKSYKNLSDITKEKYKLLILGRKDGFITPDLDVFKFIEENDLTENIFFTGYISDEQVPFLYQKACLFVFPSLYEGFGLPILEAMASGVPVLSSNASSLPEVGGNSVIYFNPLDTNELSKLIDKLLTNEDLREFLIEKGKQQAKLFSWKPAIQQHIILIKKIMKER